jgi:hypothetical protein
MVMLTGIFNFSGQKMTQRRRLSLYITFKLRKGSILKNIKQSNFVDISPVGF